MGKHAMRAVALATTLWSGSSGANGTAAQDMQSAAAATRPRSILSSVTLALPPCDNVETGVPPRNVGVIRIRLDQKVVVGGGSHDPGRLARSVRYKPGHFDIALEDEDATTGEQPNKPKNTKEKAEPFHIYLNDPDNGIPAAGLLVVRVLIKNGAKYRFFTGPDFRKGMIYGVGSGDVNNDGALCGPIEVRPKKSSRQVATFYIDLGKIPRGEFRPFNIAIQDNDAPETPVFIDPKVRNDG